MLSFRSDPVVRANAGSLTDLIVQLVVQPRGDPFNVFKSLDISVVYFQAIHELGGDFYFAFGFRSVRHTRFCLEAGVGGKVKELRIEHWIRVLRPCHVDDRPHIIKKNLMRDAADLPERTRQTEFDLHSVAAFSNHEKLKSGKAENQQKDVELDLVSVLCSELKRFLPIDLRLQTGRCLKPDNCLMLLQSVIVVYILLDCRV